MHQTDAGSATLSLAYAGAKFANANALRRLRGLNGEKGVITPTFVKSPLFTDQGIDFFVSNVELGVNSVEKILLSRLLDVCLPELKKNTEKGKTFVAYIGIPDTYLFPA